MFLPILWRHMMSDAPLSLASPPTEIVNALFGGLIQAWLDAGHSILPEINVPTAGDASTAQIRAARNPADEEKVRIIALSGLQLWYMFTRNPATQARIMNFITALSDPAKWDVIANLVWGP